MKRASLCAFLCALLGCGGGDDDSGAAGMGGAAGGAGMDGMDVSFEDDVMPFVTEACRCHQSEIQPGILMASFSLKEGEAYDQLVSAASLDVPSMVRVKPGSLNESYLWHKINGTQAEVGGKGAIMPPTVPLNEEEKNLFGRWILAGAKP